MQYWYVINHGWFMFTVPGEHKKVGTYKNKFTAQLISIAYCIIKFPNLHTVSPSYVLTKEEASELRNSPNCFTVNTR